MLRWLSIIPIAGLCACASDEHWQRIGPGLELAQAQAYCDTASMGVGTGVYAQGSPAFVAGAALGGAVGTAIAQARVYHNCMILQGWQPVPKPKKPA
jgi:hypothetical protein